MVGKSGDYRGVGAFITAAGSQRLYLHVPSQIAALVVSVPNPSHKAVLTKALAFVQGCF
jgi:hypothetical protein